MSKNFGIRFLLLLLILGPLPKGYGYNVYPYLSGGGETVYQKWGDAHAGTPGGIIQWSIIPDGTGVALTYPDANLSGTSQMESIMNGLGYTEALAAIERAFDQWSSVANIKFEYVADSGLPLDDPAANPPNTGRIRIGAYPIDAGVGAVGWAPWPFAGTYEGDVLFNANSTFYLSPGNEGDLIPIFNDFESLMLHEIGHAIGLAHSDTCAVMSVDFDCFKYINRQLDPDDIAGAQFLYGPALDEADFDEDGDVDGNDFLRWQRGETPEFRSADELAIWESQFGNVMPAVAASYVIPEPSAVLMAGISGTICFFYSRRRC